MKCSAERSEFRPFYLDPNFPISHLFCCVLSQVKERIFQLFFLRIGRLYHPSIQPRTHAGNTRGRNSKIECNNPYRKIILMASSGEFHQKILFLIKKNFHEHPSAQSRSGCSEGVVSPETSTKLRFSIYKLYSPSKKPNKNCLSSYFPIS